MQYEIIESEVCDINIRIPTGGILRPLLFIMYINDLPKILKFYKIHLFEYNMLLYISGENMVKFIFNILKLNVTITNEMFLGKN